MIAPPNTWLRAKFSLEVGREERMREFVREALASDMGVEEGAAVYRAEDVHAWLERLARNP